jgi:hypothetical protein
MDFYNEDSQYLIGEAYDLAEEARYELEDEAEHKIRALAQHLPIEHRRKLLSIWQEHIGYSMGLIRTSSILLHRFVARQCKWDGKRMSYKPRS